MILAAVLIVAFAVLAAWFVWTDLEEQAGPVFFPHDPRPLTPLVTIQARPHLYDWNEDDLFIELRGN